MSFSSRLNEVIKYYQMNPASFGKSISQGKSTMSRLLNGNSFPSYQFLTDLKKVHREIDLNWLCTGEGNMLLNNENSSVVSSLKNIILTLKEDGYI